MIQLLINEESITMYYNLLHRSSKKTFKLGLYLYENVYILLVQSFILC